MKSSIARVIVPFICVGSFMAPRFAFAQSPSGATAEQVEIEAQRKEIELLKRQMREMQDFQKALQAQLNQTSNPQGTPTPTPTPPSAPPESRTAKVSGGEWGVQIPAPAADIAPSVSEIPQVSRPSVTGISTAAPPGIGNTLSVRIKGVDVGLYGFVDVSFDRANNGQQVINEVSSNESFLGVSGGVDLGSPLLRGIFQIETMAEVSATPGVGSSIGSRNSFAGLSTPYGKFMLGKYDTPYKRDTALFDPFAGSVGDYNSIMGNTAGEGRAEFDYRMPHSFFYDSPDIYGFTLNALYSPGQKLNDLQAASNYAFPQGELVCSGSQQPSLNGATPNPQGTQTLCNDGAFKDAFSLALNYVNGPIYVTSAWEVHKSVNRESDKGGVVADESAAKIGVSYHFVFDNQFSAIYERFFRHDVAAATNERQRKGFYVSDVQNLGSGFDFMAAYANAGQTPGSPKFPGLEDGASMYAVGPKYHFNDHASVYLIGAYLTQDPGAHYGLGAGEGHGTAILSPRTNGGGPLPGKSIDAASIGVQLGF
jgi:predicted porin